MTVDIDKKIAMMKRDGHSINDIEKYLTLMYPKEMEEREEKYRKIDREERAVRALEDIAYNSRYRSSGSSSFTDSSNTFLTTLAVCSLFDD